MILETLTFLAVQPCALPLFSLIGHVQVLRGEKNTGLGNYIPGEIHHAELSIFLTSEICDFTHQLMIKPLN